MAHKIFICYRWADTAGVAGRLYIFGALFVCLFFRNSNEMVERFKPDWKSFIVLAAGAYAVLHMVEVKEFLYRFF